MPLSPDHQALWDRMKMDAQPQAEGDQTAQQADDLAVATFQMGCALEGLEVLSHDDIVAERATR